nr:Rpn family recombination-promoting nuclease/putative transposase [Treponema vincentii]
MYTADFKAGESYDKLHRCIAINIIADGFRLNDAIHSEYLLQEKTAHSILTDVLEVHFLDLQAAKRAKAEGKTEGKRGQLINWLRFIGATNRKERAMIATMSPVLQMLNEKIDVLTLSPTERKLYESRMKLKSDIATISETQFSAGVERGLAEGKSLGLAEGKSLGLAEGKSIGLAEGEARGSRQKALETARNLLVIGLSIENIAKVTGLTVQEVETLNS